MNISYKQTLNPNKLTFKGKLSSRRTHLTVTNVTSSDTETKKVIVVGGGWAGTPPQLTSPHLTQIPTNITKN